MTELLQMHDGFPSDAQRNRANIHTREMLTLTFFDHPNTYKIT